MLLLLLPASILSIGCSIQTKETIIEIHPIEQSDIVMVKKGETIIAPKDGAFLSNLYIEQVMKARIGK